ncbi:MAG: hotdog fold thioesterase [Anaerolineae bacterium]
MDREEREGVLAKIRGDPFGEFMGITPLKVEEGYSLMAMTVGENMLNFHSIAHGGAIFTLADAAFAAASNSYGIKAVALNVNITYLSTVEAGVRLLAEAKEESQGDRIRLYHIRVTTEDGRLVASFQGLVYRMLGKPLSDRPSNS